MILRNDIQDLPQGTDVAEEDVFYQDYLLREILIREKGKGNALDKGIRRAKNNLICVLDADFILKDNALSKAVRHFENDEVATVGEGMDWFLDYRMEDTRDLVIILCMIQLPFAIPESLIASKDYCINGIDGKEA